MEAISLCWPGPLKWPPRSERFFVSADWDRVLIAFLRRAGQLLDPACGPSDQEPGRGQEQEHRSRDDNGAYYWQGSYRLGDEHAGIRVSWSASQAEESLWPMPRDERRRYALEGLSQGSLELILDYEEYAAELRSIRLSLWLEPGQNGTAEAFETIRTLFLEAFSSAA